VDTNFLTLNKNIKILQIIVKFLVRKPICRKKIKFFMKNLFFILFVILLKEGFPNLLSLKTKGFLHFLLKFSDFL